jgi:DNA-binding NarL/FixJ family response regulator
MMINNQESASEPINLVIVDDHALFREGVTSVLESQTDFKVVGQGASAQDAVRLAGALLPDIIILDIDMPGGGLEAAQSIATCCPVIKIVMLTGSESDEHLIAALKIGVRAFILKGVAARELFRILRSVAAGDSYVPPALAASLLLEIHESKSHGKKASEDPTEVLSEREKEILEYLANGLSNKEIGEKLFLSEKTIKHYMTNILQKLQVRNRVEAALIAQKRSPLNR